MHCEININHTIYKTDLSKPIDISIPLSASVNNISAWYVPPPRFEPVKTNDFIGNVNEGGSVNFRNIFFNPHGHGTHTECVGHISKENFTINQCLKNFFALAEVVSIEPEIIANGDKVITAQQIVNLCQFQTQALIVRTLPNATNKLNRQYSNTNPPYFLKEAIEVLLQKNIIHLLTDLPSVDKEKDEGKLLAHHTFWNYPTNAQTHKTITEMVFVPDAVLDGLYLLNLMIAPFENDASPSKPVLYKIIF
ncbi:MAG: cyclase family protein [Flavobacteriales bacterium]|nr:cyclase family protein [Flavobacteriales bacterium]